MCESIEIIKTDETVIKKGRGRPKTEPSEICNVKRPKGRPKIENPCKPGQPKDPNYFNKYYHEKVKGVVINCPLCGIETLKHNFCNHSRSKTCKKIIEYKNDLINNIQQFIIK